MRHAVERAWRAVGLVAVVAILATSLGCSYLSWLVVVNNRPVPAEVVWRGRNLPCTARPVLPLSVDWTAMLGDPGNPEVSAEPSDAGGAPGCRAVVPSRSVLLLHGQVNHGYDMDNPVDYLAVAPGEPDGRVTASNAAAMAEARAVEDFTFAYVVGPPPTLRERWSLAWLLCGPALLFVLVPILFGAGYGYLVRAPPDA